MRLACVRDVRHPFADAMRQMTGAEPPDVVKTMLYRPERFGEGFGQLCHEAMRGPSEWTSGERELFAAFVSDRNRCVF